MIYKMDLELIQTKPKKHVDSIRFQIRPETTDIKVIDEVVYRNCYQKKLIDFMIKPGQVWLDLGGNIGTFAVLALKLGVDKVICYEPEPDNYQLLTDNLTLNQYDPTKYSLHREAVASTDTQEPIKLYLCKGTYNKYRHSLIKIRGRQTILIDCVGMDTVRQRNPEINCIKMDIEGAEIDILENYDNWDGIDQLVFEYSFDVDASIPRFMNIIEKLKQSFQTVHYLKVKPNELEYTYYPRATMVYCLKN